MILHALGAISALLSMPTYERLDRCFANVEWCNEFPNIVVYNLPTMYSDHAPILTVSNPMTVKSKRTFKLEHLVVD